VSEHRREGVAEQQLYAENPRQLWDNCSVTAHFGANDNAEAALACAAAQVRVPQTLNHKPQTLNPEISGQIADAARAGSVVAPAAWASRAWLGSGLLGDAQSATLIHDKSAEAAPLRMPRLSRGPHAKLDEAGRLPEDLPGAAASARWTPPGLLRRSRLGLPDSETHASATRGESGI